ncbi:MAG: DUF1573 domain-containing protein [Lachnospirales bacterium]
MIILGQANHKGKKEAVELEINNRNFNFVDAKQDTLISKTFVFKNISKKDITLSISSASCTCTKTELNKKKLMPGEEGELLMQFDTKNKVGESKVYTIIEANTKQKFYKFLIYGNVIPKK